MDDSASAPQSLPEEPVVFAQGLSRHYGHISAVNELSFTLMPGEIVGFLGPNGAGKTTTMRMLTGALAASRGSVHICGLDVFEHPVEVKKMVGYLPEVPPLYSELTVREQLDFVGSLKGLKPKLRRESMEIQVERCGLKEVLNRLVSTLSKGFRQRVGLAQALLGSPKVLILDEPTAGLDPQQILEVRELIRELSMDQTVILSTHILQEVTKTCERVVMLRRGERVLDSSLNELAEKHPNSSLEEIFLNHLADEQVN